MQTQDERIRHLSQKRILFVTSRPFFEIAYAGQSKYIRDTKEWGCDVWIALDTKDTRLYERLKEDNILPPSGNVIFADMEDDQENISANILAQIEALGISFDGFYTTNEHAMLYVGEIMSILKEKDLKFSHANAFRPYLLAKDKYLTREACKEKGLLVPAYYLINTIEDLEKIPFPEDLPPSSIAPSCADHHPAQQLAESQLAPMYCLKPTAGGNSAGVYLIRSKEELYARYKEIEQSLALDPYMAYGNKGKKCHALVEQYVDGIEVDVDILMLNGEVKYINMIDNWETLLPYFMETGSNLPSLLSQEIINIVQEYAVECLRACGFVMGCFHIEIKYSTIRQKPVLIEINARIGGGRTRELHQRVFGIDLLLESIMLSCGININPLAAKNPIVCVGEYELTSTTSGVLLNNNYLDHLKENPNVIYYKYTKPPGSFVKGTDLGIPTWLAHFLVSAETPEKAVAITKQIVDAVVLPIDPIASSSA